MAKTVEFMAGKKTYLLAGLLVLVTLALLAAGKLTVSTALTLLLFAAAGFPATFRDALQRHHCEVVELLTEIATTGAAVAMKNPVAARAAGIQAAEIGEQLAQEICQERQAAPMPAKVADYASRDTVGMQLQPARVVSQALLDQLRAGAAGVTSVAATPAVSSSQGDAGR